ncbi:hypothetical protein [Microbacterium sp. 179-I 3D4 NHS]|uniref:hypothetical protein n=1 Tax=Microbacterium sp. 179-I 3D4 NHS TaxID=3142381 RepID=UPI0039A0EAAD
MAYQSPEAVAAGAPAWPMPAPQRPAPGGILGFVWVLWPWMNWIVPVFVVFHGFLGSGGWETLMLAFASPIVVPASGLLGALPRFILRRRGHATTPGPIAGLLFLNWWAWFTAAITMPGAGDSGSIDSLLRAAVTAPLSQRYEEGLYVGSIVVALVAWTTVLVLACLLRPASPPALPASWTAVTWIAAFVVPALLVAAVQAGVVVTAQQRDAAGVTVVEAEALPIAAQAALAQERYALTQERLSSVRGIVAEDGWRIRSEDGRYLGQSTFGSRDRECEQADAECYGFDIRFVLEGADARSLDAASIVEELRAAGWDLPATGRLEATDDDGFTLRLEGLGAETVRVEMTSPIWWGEKYGIREELGLEPTEEDRSRTYRFDEWPPLG